MKRSTAILSASFIILLFLSIHSSAQNPGGVAGAKLWLKANAGVEVTNINQVLRWNNQSTFGDITTEADTVSKNLHLILLHPKEFNFNQAISFEGLDTSYLRGTAATGFNTTSTLFAVCRLTNLPNPSGETLLGVLTSRNTNNGGGGQGISVGGNATSPYYFIDANGAQRGNTASANTSSGELALISGEYVDNTSTLNSTINKNGTFGQQYTGGTPVNITPDCQAFEVGGRSFNFQPDRAFFGSIAELIYYPVLLNNTNNKKVESYLALKYGITLGAAKDSNYVSSNGTIIWQGNAAFQQSVFGIGRDNGSGLIITESNSMDNGSGDGSGQEGKGNIVIRNPSNLSNGDFLLVGNNTASFAEQSTDLPPDGIFSLARRVGREWRVQHTNSAGTIDLSFDIHGLSLSGDPGNIALLVSQGDNDFINGVYRFYNTPILTDSILTFSGITLNNNDYFSFVTNLSDPLPQTGDYRSKTSGIWNSTSSWETFDGANWINATIVPNDANANLVTIRSGDTITQNLDQQRMDQVLIDSGGLLHITESTQLNNGSGTDLIVNTGGEIDMTAGSIVGGAASINNTGTIAMGLGALFAANFTNNGMMSLTTTDSKTFGIPQFINNGSISWNTGGTLNFGTSHLTNNGNFTVSLARDLEITGVGTITNSAGGVLDFDQTSTIVIAPAFENFGMMIFHQDTSVFNGTTFTNSGILKGGGVLAINGSLSNTGIFQPGLSPGILTVGPSYSGGILGIELLDASGAGTGHDQLAVNGTADISNVTLNVIDAGVPVGDYIILTATGGVTGTFLNAGSFPNYTIIVNSNDVILRVNAILPLTWVSFSGSYTNNKVTLDWITGSEINTSHFVIERSSDGRNFGAIGQVKARGNTVSNSNYQFIDTVSLNQQTIFYRIKQVDLDGKFSYSKTILVIIEANSEVYLFPNPVSDNTNLVIHSKKKGELKYRVIDNTGRIFFTNSVSYKEGNTTWLINTSQLASGMYYLEMRGEEFNRVISFIKK